MIPLNLVRRDIWKARTHMVPRVIIYNSFLETAYFTATFNKLLLRALSVMQITQ